MFIISLPGRKEEGCREQMHRNLLIAPTLPRERVQFLPRRSFEIVKMGFAKNVNDSHYGECVCVDVMSRRMIGI